MLKWTKWTLYVWYSDIQNTSLSGENNDDELVVNFVLGIDSSGNEVENYRSMFKLIHKRCSGYNTWFAQRWTGKESSIFSFTNILYSEDVLELRHWYIWIQDKRDSSKRFS